MNYSVGVEYALHTLVYLVKLENNESLGIKALASINNISPSYLSKVYTKLKKAQIVLSTPGVNGGYSLSRKASAISFLDIINAIEGESKLFQCHEIRSSNSVYKPPLYTKPCLIKSVMDEAQQQMLDYLSAKTLQWLYDEVFIAFDDSKRNDVTKWLKDNVH